MFLVSFGVVGLLDSSSQGTVKSRSTTCLGVAEVSTTSGLSDVVATFSGNFSCFPRSTFSSQSYAIASRARGRGPGSSWWFFPSPDKGDGLLHCGTFGVVRVRSSIKALIDGCRMADLVRGPLH